MSASAQAIFLSYASQDADAAQRICDALRAAGLEVWFDQNELRGGDAWDASIRKKIKECALFVPIISTNTQSRSEGYFRLEWKLAVDRSHLMADDRTFLLPVVIDDTPETMARVPDRFRERQWTRLPGGATPAEFAERVQRLLSGGAAPPSPVAPPRVVPAAAPAVTTPTHEPPSIAVHCPAPAPAPGERTPPRRFAGPAPLYRGRLDEAIELDRRALEQGPLSATTYHSLGHTLHATGRLGEAEAAYRKALELSPQIATTRATIALNLLAQGRGEEALTEVLREAEEWARLWATAIIHHAAGHRAESDAALQELIAKYQAEGAYQVAEVYAARGEADLAFEWLERAYTQRDSGLSETKTDPRLSFLHADPRWDAFLRKMGLAD